MRVTCIQLLVCLFSVLPSLMLGQEKSQRVLQAIADYEIEYDSIVLEAALNEAEAENNQEDIADLSYSLGVHALEEEEDYDKAMDLFIRSRKIWEAFNDNKGIERASSRLSTIHFYHAEYDEAIRYGEEALSISRENNARFNESLHLGNLGSIYGRIPDKQSRAIEYLKLALEIGVELQDSITIQTSYNNLGVVYDAIKDFAEAEKHYLAALKFAILLHDDAEACRVTTNLASVALARNRPQDALQYLNENTDRCSRADLRIRTWMTKMRAQTHSMLGNYEEAYASLERCVTMNDSLYNLQKTEALAEMVTKYESEQKQQEISFLTTKDQLNESRISRQRTILVSVASVLLLLAVLTYVIIRDKKRSEWLLSNILPQIAIRELKKIGKVQARKHESVSILFTDFVGFTAFASKLSPEELVGHIDACYQGFDSIMKKHGCEKIKTIGDAYMAVCGLTSQSNDHAETLVRAAQDILAFMGEYNQKLREHNQTLGIRLGIHSGEVVAGVVGLHKFAYDVWGDAVNVAARMEQNSLPWRINISATTAALLSNGISLENRGALQVKGKAPMEMYFVV